MSDDKSPKKRGPKPGTKPERKQLEPEEKSRQLKERKELEDLIKCQEESLMTLTEEANSILPKQCGLKFDNEQATLVAIRDSADIVSANAQFFLGDEVIKGERYIQEKMKIDTLIVSDLRKTSIISDWSILKMIENIDEGNNHPRAYEVLSTLQKTKMDVSKLLAQYVTSMENNYKNIKEDYKVKKKEEALEVEFLEVDGTPTKKNGDVVSRGSKDMIRNLRMAMDEMETEDAEAEIGEIEKIENI